AALKEEIRKFNIIGGELKQWVNTRWHTVYECVNSIIRLKEPLENIQFTRNSFTSSYSILCLCAFFDDVRVLVFILGPIKKAITILESCSCNIADCFCELIHFGASINKLSLSDYSTFRKQCIAIFNKRYNEFADPLYLLCFFLHPQYNESYWAHGTFRELLLAADEKPPFDISYSMSETPLIWWFSLEDSFPKNEDYLVQLALKLFSIVPHAAGCEHVWSKLGWLYGLRRNRLALHKIENMHKLASYYYSHAKHELPYFGIEKTNTEVFDILVDEYLNLDEDDFVEIDKVGLNKHEENTNLNYYDENREETSSTNQLQEDIDWDPIEEVDKIIENI
ncbi:38657_t:CDS:2, partial [Gigaspora margarita]